MGVPPNPKQVRDAFILAHVLPSAEWLRVYEDALKDPARAFHVIFTNLALLSEVRTSLPKVYIDCFETSRNLAAYWANKLRKVSDV